MADGCKMDVRWVADGWQMDGRWMADGTTTWHVLAPGGPQAVQLVVVYTPRFVNVEAFKHLREPPCPVLLPAIGSSSMTIYGNLPIGHDHIWQSAHRT